MSDNVFSGYVLDFNESTNSALVWIPSKVPYLFENGSTWRTFGKNLNNCIGKSEVAKLRDMCSGYWFYLTNELTSGSLARYDEVSGNSTVYEANRSSLRMNDLRKNQGEKYKSYPYGTNFTYKWPQDNPAQNLCQNYNLNLSSGYSVDVGMNAPKGSFTSLEVGTRVIVSFINNGTLGVILRQYPNSDELSLALSGTR